MRRPEEYATIGFGTIVAVATVSIVLWWTLFRLVRWLLP